MGVSTDRVAIRITQARLPHGAGPKRHLAHRMAARKHAIMKLAHDSGDGETLFHCPFCGSGQIVARSDGAVDCDFCNTAFTVQVQPQMPAFPQTMNGIPIDVPGMPKGGENADVPPDEAAAAGYPPDGGGSDPADPGDTGNDNPFGNDDAGGDPAPDDSSSPPPFGKQSALRTTAGRAVPPEAFMAWLALQHTPDRATTLARSRTYQQRS